MLKSASSSRRRKSQQVRSIDFFSPGPSNISCNWPTNHHDIGDADDDDFRCGLPTVGNGNGNSEMQLLMMMARWGLKHPHRHHHTSSFASCNSLGAGAASAAEFPATPTSPSLCSIASSRSFATPDRQVSCVADDEVYDAFRRDDHNKECDGSRRRRRSLMSAAAARHEQFPCEDEICSVGTTNYYADDDDDRRLATAVVKGKHQEVEEEREGRWGAIGRYEHAQFSSGRSSYDGSPYNNTDIESLIEERIRSNVEASRQFRAKYRNNSRENKLAARICNWKERQKRKIINKLKRKKAAVEAWEKRTTEAKNDMRKLKMLLKHKQAQEMQGIRRKMRSTEKKVKKTKTTAARKKIDGVTDEFEKNTTRAKQLPSWLFFQLKIC